jgi:agmatine/peptidylarginine deiminase
MKTFVILITVALFSLLSAQPLPPVRMVAEWEPAFGTLIRWPLGIPSTLVRELALDDSLYVLVANSQQQNTALSNFTNWNVNLEHVVFIQAQTNSHWTRDWGPVSIFSNEGEWAIVDFVFNGYPWVPPFRERDYELDNAVNSLLANFFQAPLYQMPLYFTGGNVMTDGYGNTFSTQQMLSENASLATPAAFFSTVHDYTGTTNYHIVNNFESYGIQHIDCVAKLVNEETVLIKQVPQWHADYYRIESIVEQFGRIGNCFGRPYRIYRLPDNTGNSAYTNSLILNKKVFVPLFSNADDEAALQTYVTAMPGYEIIGIPYSNWYNYDALHCRTMAIFDRYMLYLAHRPLDSYFPANEDIIISAQIRAHSGEQLILENLNIVWRVDNGVWQILPLNFIEGITFSATIPAQPIHSFIQYYITASDNSDRTQTLPRTAPEAYYSFTIIAASTTDETVLMPISRVSAYPNPFNPQTTIEFSLSNEQVVTLSVYNVKGQKIETLLDERLESGKHYILWNAAAYHSGVYLFELKVGRNALYKKAVLIK